MHLPPNDRQAGQVTDRQTARQHRDRSSLSLELLLKETISPQHFVYIATFYALFAATSKRTISVCFSPRNSAPNREVFPRSPRSATCANCANLSTESSDKSVMSVSCAEISWKNAESRRGGAVAATVVVVEGDDSNRSLRSCTCSELCRFFFVLLSFLAEECNTTTRQHN